VTVIVMSCEAYQQANVLHSKELCTKPQVLKCKFVYNYLATSYRERLAV